MFSRFLPDFWKNTWGHVLIWTIYFLLGFISMSQTELGFLGALWRLGIMLPIHMALFYTNAYFLMPVFFEKKKPWIYFISLIFMGSFAVFIFAQFRKGPPRHAVPPHMGILDNEPNRFLGPPPHHHHHGPPVNAMGEPIAPPMGLPFLIFPGNLLAGAPILVILFFSYFYRTTQMISNRAKREAALREDKLEAEMKFLKSQVNPHLLFNTLNNIYTLAYIKSDKTAEMILKLSDLLRYMLYETQEKTVSLSKEVDCLKNYIALQMLKDDELNIEVDFSNINGSLKVAPMMLISFLENSFKHSKIEDLENGWIRIRVSTDIDNKLFFCIENSVPKIKYTKDKVGGVGLVNVKRQLKLMYGDKYTLDISNQTDRFSVYLALELNPADYESNKMSGSR